MTNRTTSIWTAAAGFLALAGLSACAENVSYSGTMAAIERSENLLKQSERDGLPETQAEMAVSLDSLYTLYVNTWPDSVHAPQFLFNKANLRAEYHGDFDGCIRLLDSLRTAWPQSAYAERAQFLIGYTYANQLQDTANARKAYESFLQAYPESDLAPSVRFEINMLGKTLDMLDSLLNNIPRD